MEEKLDINELSGEEFRCKRPSLWPSDMNTKMHSDCLVIPIECSEDLWKVLLSEEFLSGELGIAGDSRAKAEAAAFQHWEEIAPIIDQKLKLRAFDPVPNIGNGWSARDKLCVMIKG